MRRLISFVLIFLLCALPVHAQPRPRPGDMHLLLGLQRNTHIEIESTASNQYVDLDERCHLLSVDANTLTCAADDDRNVRLTFPMDKVEAVYQVHGKSDAGAILGLALLGTLLAGLATVCAPAIGVGLLGGLIDLVVMKSNSPPRWWWGIPPPPPPPSDRLTLVYQR